MAEDITVLLEARAQRGFIETPYIKELTERCLSYLRCGFPVHLQGRAGTGKTSLALHIATRIGRPVVFLFGCDEFGVADLVGGVFGYRQRTVVDNYIHSVHKTEIDAVTRWVDERLTTACKYGHTLVYDEFTRSRPETNNVLLSVLEERILDIRSGSGSRTYLQVNPEFSAIFTSNPEEYAGVHKSQDALRDRMVTVNLDEFDYETEVAITRAKSGLAPDDAAKIVNLVRAIREQRDLKVRPTVRACIVIAKVMRESKAAVSLQDPRFVNVCVDAMSSSVLSASGGVVRKDELEQRIRGLIGGMSEAP